ncbi:hypothetical protein T4C_10919 [Trichinella pseudospiralis]|uniref:Uncharacterized protein n=1 Tax=Trichinella pseudospiralis TaxID=6337 RepID=A0A0V1GBB8_TRIPS|nr:hypothetical protein T4C_10919 [Trichinella pseudospiralis]
MFYTAYAFCSFLDYRVRKSNWKIDEEILKDLFLNVNGLLQFYLRNILSKGIEKFMLVHPERQ